MNEIHNIYPSVTRTNCTAQEQEQEQETSSESHANNRVFFLEIEETFVAKRCKF